MDDSNELEQLEIDLLLNGVFRRYGYDFRNYSPRSLRRRILRAVELEEVGSIAGLLDRILRDRECMARFIETLSVHVTSMFRDPVFYQVLREEVIPKLGRRSFIRIWHAGCSTGEEVYSMAILLHEEGLYERSRLYATDISAALLEQAASGVFPLEHMKAFTRNYHRAGGRRDFSSYYTAGQGRAIFRQQLRRNMVYSTHNLVSDPPFNDFDLILCRNVMIYFDAALRQRVIERFDGSLTHFGYLALGTRENLDDFDLRERYSGRLRNQPIYRKES